MGVPEFRIGGSTFKILQGLRGLMFPKYARLMALKDRGVGHKSVLETLDPGRLLQE